MTHNTPIVELRDRITNMFLQNSQISMFGGILPEVLNTMGCEVVSGSLATQIEDVIKTVLLDCKSRGRDFVVYPKFGLDRDDNTIMRITDFIYDDIATQAAQNISINITYGESDTEEVL